MSGNEFLVSLESVLGGLDSRSALKSLHFAARIVSHRTGRATPWLPDVVGEPDVRERRIAEKIVGSAEQSFGRPLPEWDGEIANAFSDVLMERALKLSGLEINTEYKMRARSFLTQCRSHLDLTPNWILYREPIQPIAPLAAEDEQLLRMRLDGLAWRDCGAQMGLSAEEAKNQYLRVLARLAAAAVE